LITACFFECSKRQRLLGDLKWAAGITDTLLAIEAKKLKTETPPTDQR